MCLILMLGIANDPGGYRWTFRSKQISAFEVGQLSHNPQCASMMLSDGIHAQIAQDTDIGQWHAPDRAGSIFASSAESIPMAHEHLVDEPF